MRKNNKLQLMLYMFP